MCIFVWNLVLNLGFYIFLKGCFHITPFEFFLSNPMDGLRGRMLILIYFFLLYFT